MTFIRKIIYTLGFTLITSLAFFSTVNADGGCSENQKIPLNTDVPGVGTELCADEATDKFGGLMGGMMKVFLNITVAVAFLMLVASGVMIAMGGADQGMATKGKDLFKKVLIGIALIGLTGLILHTINPNFWTV